LEVGYTLDPRFSPDERLVIAEAARVWERGSGGRVCFREGGGDLRFIRLAEQRELEVEDPDWQRHVALCKAGKIWLVPSKVDDRSEYVALVIHELGHHLGLAHIEDTATTYMHSTINDTPASLRLSPQIPVRDRREFCKVHRCTCSW
jgi:hypothetical protein